MSGGRAEVRWDRGLPERSEGAASEVATRPGQVPQTARDGPPEGQVALLGLLSYLLDQDLVVVSVECLAAEQRASRGCGLGVHVARHRS